MDAITVCLKGLLNCWDGTLSDGRMIFEWWIKIEVESVAWFKVLSV
jgi:hypothetical protein